MFLSSGPQEVKKQLSQLQVRLNNDEKKLQHQIGDQYTDLIQLSLRLQSLKTLTDEQHKRLNSVLEPKNYPLHNSLKADQTLNSKKQEQLAAFLAFHADKCISQQQLANAAFALYFASNMSLNSTELNQQNTRLSNLLETFLISGSLTSVSIYHALLVHFKLPPAELLQVFLNKRLEKIKNILFLNADSLFPYLDTTLFVYSQLSEYAETLLVNKLITNLKTFSFALNAKILPPSDLNCFPSECFEKSKSSSNITDFCKSVANLVKESSTQMLENVEFAELSALLKNLILQSMDVFTAGQDVVEEMLLSLVPAFEKKYISFVDLIDVNLTTFSNVFTQFRHEVNELSKISKLVKIKRLSEMLTLIVNELNVKLNLKITSVYNKLRTEITGSPDKVLLKQNELNISMEKLGLEYEPIASSCFEEFANKIKQELNINKTNCFGGEVTYKAFKAQCLIDDYLPNFTLPTEEAKLIQKIILESDLEIVNDGLLLSS